MRHEVSAVPYFHEHHQGPVGGLAVYQRRRARFFERMLDRSVALIFNAPEAHRNGDNHFAYRPDSTFFYLTGFREPGSMALFEKNGDQTKLTLFVAPRDLTKETWNGFVYGVERAKSQFGADQVFSNKELEPRLSGLMRPYAQVYCSLGDFADRDALVLNALKEADASRGKSHRGLADIFNVAPLVGELRLFKDELDLSLLRQACEMSAKGHLAAMKMLMPGLREFEVQAEVEREFRRFGASGLAYDSIVASGDRANTLHYIYNDGICHKGDLLLVDAGAEYHYMSGDVTRTIPVSGKFTSPQLDLYEAVLDAQLKCIDAAKPGARIADIHDLAVRCLTESMLHLKILKGSVDENVEQKNFRRFYMHGTSHWLGMDVHDCGRYVEDDGSSRVLKLGMCLTVEPGLYFKSDELNVPEAFRGIGIRIEDDVLVTENGCEVLTSLAPKHVAEIETAMAK